MLGRLPPPRKSCTRPSDHRALCAPHCAKRVPRDRPVHDKLQTLCANGRSPCKSSGGSHRRAATPELYPLASINRCPFAHRVDIGHFPFLNCSRYLLPFSSSPPLLLLPSSLWGCPLRNLFPYQTANGLWGRALLCNALLCFALLHCLL